MHRITEAEEVLHVAEFGIVFLLFVIGLELKPSRLWQMRGDVFGLGPAQVILCGAVLTGLMMAAGLADWRGSLIIGFGLALSSTAFAVQILNDEGDLNSKYGQRAFSILLFQDLAIVPLLALTSILATGVDETGPSAMRGLPVAFAAIATMVLAGRFLLTPLFQVIARTGAREVMIATALLIALGSAAAMQAVGLSMAMGAFLAGVMLAESSYRHELEADIEPFRGTAARTLLRRCRSLARTPCPVESTGADPRRRPRLHACQGIDHLWPVPPGGVTPQRQPADRIPPAAGGEFGFVLFTTAVGAGLLSSSTASLLIAVVTLSMALTPVGAALSRRLLRIEREELEETFEGAGADVLMIGFSRFGQIAAQILLAGGREVTVIDDSADRVRQAASFGFRIYFGDGTRKDVLLASGIKKAKIVAVLTQKREVTDRIVDLIRSEFPNVRLFVRSYDRIHTLSLRERDVEYELRETLESGLVFGRKTLEALGMSMSEAEAIEADIRRRDEERLLIQAAEGIAASGHMLHNRPVKPEPLIKPKHVTPTEATGMEAEEQPAP
nr:potassium transporter TrkA [Rhizobium sp. Q54]